MLISFGGRIGSGKSTLKDILVNDYKFNTFSFAGPLKEYVSRLYGIPIKWCYSQKDKEKELKHLLIWDEYRCGTLSEIIGEVIEWNGETVEFKTLRHALQYIGTEVLRTHDVNFHVSRSIENLEYGGTYVNDDLRFKNELITMQNFGAHCIFVNRETGIASDHASENELQPTDFDYIIENDGSIEDLKQKFMVLYKLILKAEEL